MTVTQDAAQTRDADAERDPLDVLTVAELDLVLAKIRAGWRATAIVHEPLCPLWNEQAELLGELHATWCAVFDRAYPGIRDRTDAA
jgi:hypothetical protein